MAKVHLTVRVQPESKTYFAGLHKDGAGAALDQIAKARGVTFKADADAKKAAAAKPAKPSKSKKEAKPKLIGTLNAATGKITKVADKKPAKVGISVTKDNAAKIVASVAKNLPPLAAARANRAPILRPGQAAKK